MSPRWNKDQEEKVEQSQTEEVQAHKETPVPHGEPQVSVLRSEIDAFLQDRMRSQPKTLEEVETRVVEKPQAGKHQMSIPDELKEYEKKFAFCWIFKHKKAVDEACNLYHWVICNKTFFPEIAKSAPHVFSANGAIELGDNILAFRSRQVDDFMRKAPGLESAQRIKDRTEAHKNDPSFYVPQSDEFEKDPITGKTIKVPIVGV